MDYAAVRTRLTSAPAQKFLPVPLSHEQELACSGDLALHSWCLEEVDLVCMKGKFTEECTRFPVLAWGTVTTTCVSGVVTNSSTVCLALQFLPSVFWMWHLVGFLYNKCTRFFIKTLAKQWPWNNYFGGHLKIRSWDTAQWSGMDLINLTFARPCSISCIKKSK